EVRQNRPQEPDDGHSMGTATAGTRTATAIYAAFRVDSSGTGVHQTPAQPLLRRVLDVREAAAYLGLSVCTTRELISAGKVPRVRIADMRRVLVDVRDLDQLIEFSKT